MNPAELTIKCSYCGMPLAEGNLISIMGRLCCENCLPEHGPRVCDFCQQFEPGWRYQVECDITLGIGAEDLSTDMVLTKLQGDWAACDACMVLVEDNDLSGLVTRLIVVLGVPKDAIEHEDDFKEVIRTFFTVVLGSLKHPPIKETKETGHDTDTTY